jgi:hypothetical protein
MHDPWISGTAGASYQLTASGADSAAFWQSAEGTLQFDLRDAVLFHIVLASDEGPLQIARWHGRAHLRHGKIEFDNADLISSENTYEIEGTASLARELNFKLGRGEPGRGEPAQDENDNAEAKPANSASPVYAISGTLEEPQVVLISTPQTQAKLKP